MSAFLPRPPQRVEPDGPSSSHVDPEVRRVWAERRWQTQAARWRARALAESIFEGAVSVQVTGGLLQGRFRGLLHLEVPFERLTEHREREARFTAAAGQDPILAAVPFVYVFSAAEGA